LLIEKNQNPWSAFWHRKLIFKTRHVQQFSFRIELKQDTIIKYLYFKKMKIAEIHHKLMLCLVDDTYTPASIKH
jgi:hypothetical protein